jgi:CRP/FNR family cyclic AMP-dependent transcriptional regulator
MIVEGRVRVVNYGLSGREVTLDEMPEGSYFGELSAIDGRPRSARVIALTHSPIAALPGNRFLEILTKHPPCASKVLIQSAGVVRASNERIMDLSTLGANNRVHAELLRQAHENMDGDNKAVIKPNPLHGDIASRVSATRETVARVMNDLARQDIVERTKKALVIVDVEKLNAMVQEVRGE